jgi:hypothetical protein
MVTFLYAGRFDAYAEAALGCFSHIFCLQFPMIAENLVFLFSQEQSTSFVDFAMLSIKILQYITDVICKNNNYYEKYL